MKWQTAITKASKNELIVDGTPIQDLMQAIHDREISLGTIFSRLTRMPNLDIPLFEAMLVAICDHGLCPPSTIAVRMAATGGATAQSAVAAGLCCLGDYHGVLEPAAKAIEVYIGTPIESIYLKPFPGLGHPIHGEDPRVTKLFELAKGGPHRQFILSLAKHKDLTINPAGAIASIWLDYHYPVELINGVFVLGRTFGMLAHYYEERTQEKPLRIVKPEEIDYIGP